MSEIKICSEDFSPSVICHYREKAFYDVPEHEHDFLMVYYVTSGQMELEVEGKNVTARKGDLVLINPHVKHSRKKAEAMIFVLAFGNFQIKGIPMNTLPVAEPLMTPVQYPHELYDCYRSIVEEQEKKEVEWDLLTKVRSSEFLVWILKELSPKNSPGIDGFFQLKMYDKETIAKMIKAYFRENYMKRISVEEIARYTYLSTTYVNKIFKEVVGDTPINYLITLRMEKARDMLSEGRFSVQETAKLVGYDDPYYFSKLFKKRYGQAPSVFKKERNL